MITINRTNRRKIPGMEKTQGQTVATQYVVPAVGPRGQFLECKVSEGTGGDLPVKWSREAQAPVLTRKYEQQGWQLFKDYCVENECIEYYDRWEKWYHLRDAGKEMDVETWDRMRPNFYPPEILQRRKRFPDAGERLTDSEIMDSLGIEQPDAPKKRGRKPGKQQQEVSDAVLGG